MYKATKVPQHHSSFPCAVTGFSVAHLRG